MVDIVALSRTFLRVAETGSFTTVADEQGTSQPTISRQIGMLENHLGCRLFHRTTRRLSLTDEGRHFLERGREIVEAVAAAESAVGRGKANPSGTVRLAAATVMGALHVVPRLPRFFSFYPQISVQLILDDARSDLVEEGIDLAIRVGEITEPGLIARKIGQTRRVVVAAESYLSARGEPKSLAELAQHDCIVYDRLTTGLNWPFETPQGPVIIPVSGRLRVNSTEALRAAVITGLGLGLVPVWYFTPDDIANYGLRVLMQDFQARPHPVNAVFASRRHMASAVRVLIDYLADEFAADPNFNGGSETPSRNAKRPA